jgi:DNA-binding transcriptional LysR family regulator
VAAEFDNVESIKRAVINGAGLTILPEYAVRSEVEAGKLRTLPIVGSPLQRVLKLVWNRATYRSPVVRSFVRFLRRYVPALAGVQV